VSSTARSRRAGRRHRQTVSLDASKVINVTPRYAKLHATSGEVIGWENIELISDRPFRLWEDEFKKCKDGHPAGALIASIMEEYNKDAWIELVQRCEAAGVDSLNSTSPARTVCPNARWAPPWARIPIFSRKSAAG